jgi:hypothetical protein
MQKVQSLDVSFSVLERYLEEVNSRYGQIFKDFDADIDSKDALLEKIKLELKELQSSKNHLVCNFLHLYCISAIAPLISVPYHAFLCFRPKKLMASSPGS